MKNKMQLVELFNNTDYKMLTFASFFDTDLIAKSAVITISSNDELLDFSLTSEKFGLLRWVNGEGVIECGKWDEERNEMDSVSVNDLLVEDVLKDLPNDDLKVFLKRALKAVSFSEILDIDFE